jgi:hypothetical protein
VLIFGVSCLGFFVIWLLGRQVESLSDAFDSLPAALVAFGALCASPVFFYIAWHQIGAKVRLAQEHLPVCAAFGHVVGAQGGRAPRGIWRFEALDEAGNILAYYEAAAPAAGWKIEKKKNGLLLSKTGASLALWSEKKGDQEQVIVQKLSPPARQP